MKYLGTLCGLLLSVATFAAVTVKPTAGVKGLATPSTAKYISIRISGDGTQTVYRNTSITDMKPLEVGLAKPFGSKFKLTQTSGTGAEVSVQMVPWVRPYRAPLIWHLNSTWSLGVTGVIQADVDACHDAAGNSDYQSSTEITFEHNAAARSLTWTDGANSGIFQLEGDEAGWYIIIKLADAADVAIFSDSQGNVVTR